MHPAADRILLFHRDYHRLTGGHLKVRHYYSHAEHSARFRPRIFFTPGSVRGPENPWHGIAPPPLTSWRPSEAAALFIAGLDWEAVPDPSPMPVINLIQGVRHADEGDPRRAFLARPAVRICVSDEVAAAIKSTILPLPSSPHCNPTTAEQAGLRAERSENPLADDCCVVMRSEGRSGTSAFRQERDL